MRKQTKKIAFAVVLSMAMSFIAPSQISALAAPKNFYYVEQNTDETIKELALEIGEQVDLKFVGVSDYKNYTCKWVSSDEKVAVVDSGGNITARGKGTATIKYIVGDESNYTSSGVKVSVGEERSVILGTSASETPISYELQKGKTVDFNFYGLLDGAEERFTCDWNSTDPSIATVSSSGKITGLNEGITVIEAKLRNNATGTEYYARPVAIQVVDYSAIVIATPTPTIRPSATQRPSATPTPVATKIPTATPTPTEVPSDGTVYYTAKLESDNCILLTFPKGVEYDITDISLDQVVPVGNQTTEVTKDFSATVSADGLEVRITPVDYFQNGEKYVVRVGESDAGKTVIVRIGIPTQLQVSFECLGKKGVAYAYDEEVAIDVPVELSYQLYSNGVNVTETYGNSGYITYELVSPQNSEKVDLSGDILNFYSANTTATLSATFTYYDADGNVKNLTTRITVRATKLPSYGINIGNTKWTIVDDEETKIDWNNLVHNTIAGTDNQTIVALIEDTYGNRYCTDERGVDTANGVYSINDYEQLFASMGYSVQFENLDNSQPFIVMEEGGLFTYQQVSKGFAVLNVLNNGMHTTSNQKIQFMCNVEVKAPRTLSSITAKSNSAILAATALPGFEDRFCQTEVEILLKDQYGKEWTGEYNLELSCANVDVNQALDGSTNAPAYLEGTTLHINAENMMAVTNKTSVSLIITETNTKRKVTINVSLQKPTISNGEIKVSSWRVEMQDDIISIGNGDLTQMIQSAKLNIYKVSSNGIKVGLYDDASKIKVQDKANHKFIPSNCAEDEIYILVIGPDGKPVKAAENANSLGIWFDEAEDCVKVNVAAPESNGSLILESLEEGKYTVTVTRIKSVGTTVSKAVLTTDFEVKDTTKEVTLRSLKNKETSITVDGENDLASARKIVAELFVFNLDGKAWTSLTEDMITNVTYKYIEKANHIVVQSVEFAIPYGEEETSAMSYKKTVSNINRAIKLGVTD